MKQNNVIPASIFIAIEWMFETSDMLPVQYTKGFPQECAIQLFADIYVLETLLQQFVKSCFCDGILDSDFKLFLQVHPNGQQ